jgi:hypothetical protein
MSDPEKDTDRDRLVLQLRRAKRIERIMAWLSAVIGVGTFVAAIWSVIQQSPAPTSVQQTEIAQIRKLDDASTSLTRRISLVEATLRTPAMPANVVTNDVRVLHGYVETMDQRVSRIESAVGSDPAKALELPLLRKDLELLRERQDLEVTALRQELGRMYELNKWFIGLMCTMAIGVITLAVSNVLKANAPGQPQPKP